MRNLEIFKYQDVLETYEVVEMGKRVVFEGYPALGDAARNFYVLRLFDSRESRDRFEELKSKDYLLPDEQDEYHKLLLNATCVIDKLDEVLPEWCERKVRITVEILE